MAAEYINSETGTSKSPTREPSVANGADVYSGDFVTLTSGKVTGEAINNKRLLGVVMGGNSRDPARARRVADQGYKTSGVADGSARVLVNVEENGQWLVPFTTAPAATDEGKFFDLLNVAQGTLTSTGTAPANGDTVTVGDVTYTFQTSLVDSANNVLIGASAAAALDNLKSAVNATAGAGTTYGTGTVANPTATATTNTNTTQLFEAVDGSATTFVLSEVSAQLSASTVVGGPGSQRVDTASVNAELGQLVLVKANPGIRGTDSTYGIVQIAHNFKQSVAALA